MAYSVDLRERVVGFVGNGGSKAEASRRFGVSLWCGRLEKLKNLYLWEDITEEEYKLQKAEVQDQLDSLSVPEADETRLEALAHFLSNAGELWRSSTQEERNAIARTLFEQIKVKDSKVVAIKPVQAVEPFFRVSYECQQKDLRCDPDRGRGHMCNASILLMHYVLQYLLVGAERGSYLQTFFLRYSPNGRHRAFDNSLSNMECLMKLSG